MFDRLIPQWAYPPFVAFAVQMHFGRGRKIEVFDPQIGCLLYARTSVIEKE